MATLLGVGVGVGGGGGGSGKDDAAADVADVDVIVSEMVVASVSVAAADCGRGVSALDDSLTVIAALSPVGTVIVVVFDCVSLEELAATVKLSPLSMLGVLCCSCGCCCCCGCCCLLADCGETSSILSVRLFLARLEAFMGFSSGGV